MYYHFINSFVSHLVSECYVQRNDVLCRLKVITGGMGNRRLKLLIFHHIKQPITLSFMHIL